jgi:hypothetical protein
MSPNVTFRARSTEDAAPQIPDRGWRFWLGISSVALLFIGVAAEVASYAMLSSAGGDIVNPDLLFSLVSDMGIPAFLLGLLLACVLLLSRLRFDGSTGALWAAVALVAVAVFAASAGLQRGGPALAWAIGLSILSLLPAFAMGHWAFRVVWLIFVGGLSLLSIGVAMLPDDGLASLLGYIFLAGVFALQGLVGLIGLYLLAMRSPHSPASG